MSTVRRSTTSALAIVSLLGVLSHGYLVAQEGVSLSASGVAVMPRSAVLVRGNEESVTGTWVGGAFELRIGGKFVLEGLGVKGSLAPSDNTMVVGRDGGEMRGLIRVQPRDWIGLEAGYAIRAFDSAAGYQRWSIPSVGVLMSVPFGYESFTGYVRGSYLPSVSIDDLESPNFAMAVEVGVSGAPRIAPLTVNVSYRQERFDFPGGAAQRLEQFDQLMVAVGLRVGGR